MIYTILGLTLMFALGVILSNYDLKRSKKERREQLRQRARRSVRFPEEW